MNNYSVSDMVVLNEIVDLRENYYTHTIKVHKIPGGALRVFNSEEIDNKDSSFLDDFISAIVPISYTASVNELVYHEPLSRVPLYINREKYIRIFAIWRLKIAK
jgi:hypothetical protein